MTLQIQLLDRGHSQMLEASLLSTPQQFISHLRELSRRFPECQFPDELLRELVSTWPLHFYLHICPGTLRPDIYIKCWHCMKELAQSSQDSLLQELLHDDFSAHFVHISENTKGEYLYYFLSSVVGLTDLPQEMVCERLNGKWFIRGQVGSVIDAEQWNTICQYFDHIIIDAAKLKVTLRSLFQIPEYALVLEEELCITRTTLVHFIADFELFLPESISPVPLSIIRKPPSTIARHEAFQHEFIPLPKTQKQLFKLVSEMIDNKPIVLKVPDKAARTGIFYSPYTCIIQSSGAGKSKLVLGDPMISDGKRLLFIVLTSARLDDKGKIVKYDGYPRPSFLYEHFFDAMKNAGSSERFGKVLQRFMLQVVDGIFDENFVLKEKHDVGGVPVDEIFVDNGRLVLDPFVAPTQSTNLKEDWQRLKKIRDKDGNRITLSLVVDEASHLITNLPITVKDTRPDMGDQPTAATEDDGAKSAQSTRGKSGLASTGESIVQETISQFRMLRRALRAVHEPRLPTFLLSTNSRIANFLPSLHQDDSRKDLYETDSSGIKKFLHPPVVVIESFDLLITRELPLATQSLSSYLLTDEYVSNLFKYGRPLWGAFVEACGVDEALELACEKLALPSPLETNSSTSIFASKKVYSDAEFLNEVFALLILGLTAYLPPVSSYTHAVDLLQSRMGVLFELDAITGQLFVGFSSEPILAIIALEKLIGEHGGASTRAILSNYANLVRYGSISKGGAGELVARVLLLLAAHHIQAVQEDLYQATVGLLPAESKRYIQFIAPRPLVAFLGLLCRNPDSGLVPKATQEMTTSPNGSTTRKLMVSVDENMSLRELLGDAAEGWISFSHWRKVKYDKRKDLRSLLLVNLLRSAAIIPPTNFEGADLIIPFTIPDSSKSGNEEHFIAKQALMRGCAEKEAFLQDVDMEEPEDSHAEPENHKKGSSAMDTDNADMDIMEMSQGYCKGDVHKYKNIGALLVQVKNVAGSVNYFEVARKMDKLWESYPGTIMHLVIHVVDRETRVFCLDDDSLKRRCIVMQGRCCEFLGAEVADLLMQIAAMQQTEYENSSVESELEMYKDLL